MTRSRVLALALVLVACLVVGAGAWRQPPAGRPPSVVLAALDADHDGAISATEMDDAPRALRALDRDGDQRLTAAELGPGSAPPRDGSPTTASDDLVELLMGLDRDGDGRLSSKELPERFAGLLARADADKDGLLTRSEIVASATATPTTGEGGGRGGPGGGDPLVQALDADRDGTLTPEELAAAPAALRGLDRDGDGQLAGFEIRPARGRGGRGGPRGDRH